MSAIKKIVSNPIVAIAAGAAIGYYAGPLFGGSALLGGIKGAALGYSLSAGAKALGVVSGVGAVGQTSIPDTGQLATAIGEDAFVPKAYGARRGGMVLIATDIMDADNKIIAQGEANEYATSVYALGEGPWTKITQLNISDLPIFKTDSTIVFGTTYGFGDDIFSTDQSLGNIEVTFIQGNIGQALPESLSAITNTDGTRWFRDTDIGNGICYMVVRIKRDKNALIRATAPSNFTIEAEAKQIPEIRLTAGDGSVPIQYSSVTNDVTYNTGINPALIALDQLRSSPFGYGATNKSIDFDSFVRAANYCDNPGMYASYTKTDGTVIEETQIPAFTLNGQFGLGSSTREILEEISLCTGLLFVDQNGIITCKIDKLETGTTSVAINATNIVNSITRIEPTTTQLPNVVNVKFLDLKGFETIDVVELSSTIIAREGRKEADLQLRMVSTSAQAIELAKRNLLIQRQPSFEFQMNNVGYDLDVFSVSTLADIKFDATNSADIISELDANGNASRIRILGTEKQRVVENASRAPIKVSANLYADEIYNTNPEQLAILSTTKISDSPSISNISRPLNVTISRLSDTTAEINWDNIVQYQTKIEFRKYNEAVGHTGADADLNWINAKLVEDAPADITFPEAGEYEISVRFVAPQLLLQGPRTITGVYNSRAANTSVENGIVSIGSDATNPDRILNKYLGIRFADDKDGFGDRDSWLGRKEIQSIGHSADDTVPSLTTRTGGTDHKVKFDIPNDFDAGISTVENNAITVSGTRGNKINNEQLEIALVDNAGLSAQKTLTDYVPKDYSSTGYVVTKSSINSAKVEDQYELADRVTGEIDPTEITQFITKGTKTYIARPNGIEVFNTSDLDTVLFTVTPSANRFQSIGNVLFDNSKLILRCNYDNNINNDAQYFEIHNLDFVNNTSTLHSSLTPYTQANYDTPYFQPNPTGGIKGGTSPTASRYDWNAIGYGFAENNGHLDMFLTGFRVNTNVAGGFYQAGISSSDLNGQSYRYNTGTSTWDLVTDVTKQMNPFISKTNSGSGDFRPNSVHRNSYGNKINGIMSMGDTTFINYNHYGTDGSGNVIDYKAYETSTDTFIAGTIDVNGTSTTNNSGTSYNTNTLNAFVFGRWSGNGVDHPETSLIRRTSAAGADVAVWAKTQIGGTVQGRGSAPAAENSSTTDTHILLGEPQASDYNPLGISNGRIYSWASDGTTTDVYNSLPSTNFFWQRSFNILVSNTEIFQRAGYLGSDGAANINTFTLDLDAETAVLASTTTTPIVYGTGTSTTNFGLDAAIGTDVAFVISDQNLYRFTLADEVWTETHKVSSTGYKVITNGTKAIQYKDAEIRILNDDLTVNNTIGATGLVSADEKIDAKDNLIAWHTSTGNVTVYNISGETTTIYGNNSNIKTIKVRNNTKVLASSLTQVIEYNTTETIKSYFESGKSYIITGRVGSNVAGGGGSQIAWSTVNKSARTNSTPTDSLIVRNDSTSPGIASTGQNMMSQFPVSDGTFTFAGTTYDYTSRDASTTQGTAVTITGITLTGTSTAVDVSNWDVGSIFGFYGGSGGGNIEGTGDGITLPGGIVYRGFAQAGSGTNGVNLEWGKNFTSTNPTSATPSTVTNLVTGGTFGQNNTNITLTYTYTPNASEGNGTPGSGRNNGRSTFGADFIYLNQVSNSYRGRAADWTSALDTGTVILDNQTIEDSSKAIHSISDTSFAISRTIEDSLTDPTNSYFKVGKSYQLNCNISNISAPRIDKKIVWVTPDIAARTESTPTDTLEVYSSYNLGVNDQNGIGAFPTTNGEFDYLNVFYTYETKVDGTGTTYGSLGSFTGVKLKSDSSTVDVSNWTFGNAFGFYGQGRAGTTLDNAHRDCSGPGLYQPARQFPYQYWVLDGAPEEETGGSNFVVTGTGGNGSAYTIDRTINYTYTPTGQPDNNLTNSNIKKGITGYDWVATPGTPFPKATVLYYYTTAITKKVTSVYQLQSGTYNSVIQLDVFGDIIGYNEQMFIGQELYVAIEGVSSITERFKAGVATDWYLNLGITNGVFTGTYPAFGDATTCQSQVKATVESRNLPGVFVSLVNLTSNYDNRITSPTKAGQKILIHTGSQMDVNTSFILTNTLDAVNATPYTLATDANNEKPATTITAIHPSGNQIISITDGVSDTSHSTIGLVLADLKTAVDGFTSTPRDYLMTYTTSLINITGTNLFTPGLNKWLITANNNGVTGADAGNIVFGETTRTDAVFGKTFTFNPTNGQYTDRRLTGFTDVAFTDNADEFQAIADIKAKLSEDNNFVTYSSTVLDGSVRTFTANFNTNDNINTQFVFNSGSTSGSFITSSLTEQGSIGTLTGGIGFDGLPTKTNIKLFDPLVNDNIFDQSFFNYSPAALGHTNHTMATIIPLIQTAVPSARYTTVEANSKLTFTTPAHTAVNGTISITTSAVNGIQNLNTLVFNDTVVDQEGGPRPSYYGLRSQETTTGLFDVKANKFTWFRIDNPELLDPIFPSYRIFTENYVTFNFVNTPLLNGFKQIPTSDGTATGTILPIDVTETTSTQIQNLPVNAPDGTPAEGSTLIFANGQFYIAVIIVSTSDVDALKADIDTSTTIYNANNSQLTLSSGGATPNYNGQTLDGKAVYRWNGTSYIKLS